MTRSLDGTTQIELELQGLQPDTQYSVHVHDLPCAVNSGGSHYKLDDSINDTLESNEIWLNVTSDDDGDAERTVSLPFLARPEAQSIVVHGAAAARLGCIDWIGKRSG